MGGGLHLRALLGRHRLRRVLPRCVLPADPGLEGIDEQAHEPGPGRGRTSPVATRLPAERPGHRAGASLGRGQYTSIAFTERLAQAGIAPSIGSVVDAYDNALAEATIGLFKAELINRRGPWKTSRTSSSLPPSGSIGTTTADSMELSATYHQPNTKPPTITNTRTPTNPSARDIPALHRTRNGSLGCARGLVLPPIAWFRLGCRNCPQSSSDRGVAALMARRPT